MGTTHGRNWNRDIEQIQTHHRQGWKRGAGVSKRIEDITVKSHGRGVVSDKPRVAYDAVAHLNPSSIAEGIMGDDEVDPNAIKHIFENPRGRPKTADAQDRLDRGTLCHIMLLQPERLAKDVAVWTGGTRRGAAWDDFSSASVGKLVIREQDYDDVSEAVKVFQFDPKLREMLTDLDAEVAMFSMEHSFYTKGLVDAVQRPYENYEGKRIRRIIDLKTTEAGFSRRDIEHTERRFKYREKMSAYRRWYAREAEQDFDDLKCFNIWLNMNKPYGIRIREFTTEAIEWSEKRVVAALDAVQRQLDAKSWPLFVASDMVMVQNWEKSDDEPTLTFEGAAL